MRKVRTRFAPSPTGRMHVGNLRTALYAYLIAKHEGGDFILRIEDTDQARFMEGALDIIYRTLEKTGLIHDEGPDKDGGYGPYVQSERIKNIPFIWKSLCLTIHWNCQKFVHVLNFVKVNHVQKYPCIERFH